MAKKEYDVTKRFLEVAERARQTAPAKKKKPELEGEDSGFSTRPGASMRISRDRLGNKKDVNLPLMKLGKK
jgi:hypothetical protein